MDTHGIRCHSYTSCHMIHEKTSVFHTVKLKSIKLTNCLINGTSSIIIVFVKFKIFRIFLQVFETCVCCVLGDFKIAFHRYDLV